MRRGGEALARGWVRADGEGGAGSVHGAQDASGSAARFAVVSFPSPFLPRSSFPRQNLSSAPSISGRRSLSLRTPNCSRCRIYTKTSPQYKKRSRPSPGRRSSVSFQVRGAPDLAARSEEVDRSASRREEVKRSALLDQAKHELRRLCPALDLRRVVKDREAAAAASAYAKGAAAARAQWSNLEQDRRARPPPQSTSYLRTGSVLPPVLSPPQRRASHANHPAETFHPTPVASTANPATRHPSLAPSSLPLHQLPPPSSPLIFNDDVHLLALVELHDAAASAATAAGGSFPEQWADVYATAFPGTSRTKLAQRTEELSRYSRDGMKSAYVERLKGRLEEAKKNVKTAFPFLDLARTAGGAGGGWSTQRKTAAMSQRTSPADQLSPFAR